MFAVRAPIDAVRVPDGAAGSGMEADEAVEAGVIRPSGVNISKIMNQHANGGNTWKQMW